MNFLWEYGVLYPWEIIKNIGESILSIPWILHHAVVDYGQLWVAFGVFHFLFTMTTDDM